jgi:hypothetical protein
LKYDPWESPVCQCQFVGVQQPIASMSRSMDAIAARGFLGSGMSVLNSAKQP